MELGGGGVFCSNVMILGAQGKEISLGGAGTEGILRDELLHSSKREGEDKKEENTSIPKFT